MEAIFCSKCGTKIFFKGAKPNKCSGCGRSLSESSVPDSPEPSAQPSSDGESVPKLTEVQIDIEIDTVKPMTLRDHLITASPNEDPLIRDAPDLPQGDAILKEAISDCQPTQKSKDVGE